MKAETRQSHSIPQSAVGLRIDKYLAERFSDHSRSFFQKLISEHLVTVNNQPVKVSYKLEEGDYVTVQLPEPEESDLRPQNIPLDILYEDEDLIVLNKPAGMVVHPGAGVKEGTLVNALLFHFQELASLGGKGRPGIVHRLDKNTSGVLVVARNNSAHFKLAQQFAEKTAKRKYWALVWGIPNPPEGRIETHLNRSKSDRKKFTVAQSGKIAITEYSTLKIFGQISLLELHLKTGRTHQIRAHLKYLHHPVFGDPEYQGRLSQIKSAPAAIRPFLKSQLEILQRQALHAKYLGFFHPSTGDFMEFETPLPEDMQMILSNLKNQFPETH
ncbi:MAG: RluA family pseudouridine synthase [Calditrichia bacterium]